MITHSPDELGPIAVTFSGDPVVVWTALITITLVIIAVLITIGNISRSIVAAMMGRRIRRDRPDRSRTAPMLGRDAAEAGPTREEREGR